MIGVVGWRWGLVLQGMPEERGSVHLGVLKEMKKGMRKERLVLLDESKGEEAGDRISLWSKSGDLVV